MWIYSEGVAQLTMSKEVALPAYYSGYQANRKDYILIVNKIFIIIYSSDRTLDEGEDCKNEKLLINSNKNKHRSVRFKETVHCAELWTEEK